VSISLGFCGLTKLISPGSRMGLKVMIWQPRFTAA
jgi:hypothetical protein